MKYSVPPKLYDQSLPQITTAKSVVMNFLQKKSLKGDEIIIDAACGTGRLATFLSEYISSGHILGIDNAENMIEFAQENRASDKVSFQVNDLCVFNPALKKKADLIVCSWAVSHIPTEQQKDFTQNLFNYLKEDGYLLVLFPVMGSILSTVIQEVAKSETWQGYFKDFQSKRMTFTVEEYNDLLRQTGFDNRVVQTNTEHLTFSNKAELDCFVTTAVARYLPFLEESKLGDDFINDVSNHYLQKAGTTEQGIPYTMTILSAVATRPNLSLLLQTGSPIYSRKKNSPREVLPEEPGSTVGLRNI